MVRDGRESTLLKERNALEATMYHNTHLNDGTSLFTFANVRHVLDDQGVLLHVVGVALEEVGHLLKHIAQQLMRRPRKNAWCNVLKQLVAEHG
jgi:hypothetical protein